MLTIGSPQGLYSSIQVSSERSHIDNYRPISVISIIGKVFESIIYYQLFASLSDHNILSKHQSGFHVLHSTVTALLEACNIDIGNVNAVAFLDLKKAFDTVDHDILLSKLHLCGISGVTHKCFSSFFYIIILRNVLSMVSFQNAASSCVVFPKTISGPLLFLLYINDLPLNCLFHSEQRMYVDDTHLTYLSGNIHSIQTFLNEDLLNIKRSVAYRK